MRKTVLILMLMLISIFAFTGLASADEADFTFDSTTGTITGYTGPGGDVVIPSTIDGVDVVAIGASAFYCKLTLTNITIPDSVTSIGNDAFKGCTNLNSITIPDSVISIEQDAFQNCTSLTSIIIPKNVETMGNRYYSVFRGCTNLTTVTFAEGMTKIPDYACEDCIGLTSVNIPDSVTSIGDRAFSYCASLANINIPDSVTSIGGNAFSHCTSLANINIPDSVISIGGKSLLGCTSLANITIPDSVTSIGDNAFQNCTGLTNITIPKNVATMGAGLYPVFEGCTNLTTVTFAEGMTKIPDYACEDCIGLTSVNIPDSVTSIGDRALAGCSNLTSVNIPDSVTSIGNYAFSDCTSLANINIPDSVISIGGNAFYYCEALTSATIGKNVVTMGAKMNFASLQPAFKGCNNLITVTFAEGMNKIPSYAFKDCTGLTNINIPNSVTHIGGHAFSGCSSLDSVIIPENLIYVDICAFEKCTSLSSITFENKNTVNINKETLTLTPKGKEVLIYSVEMKNNSLIIGSSSSIYDATIIKAHSLSPAKAYADKYNRTFEEIPNEAITWSSDNNLIAEVDQNGEVTAKSVGVTNIRATTASGYSSTCEVTVQNIYTVTFIDWDNTTLKTESVAQGSSATAPPDPTRPNYNFTGWDKDFSNITENLTVTATYSINTYTVTFRDYDYSVLKTETVDHGDSATAPPDPTRPNYNFTGWDKTFSNITTDLIVNAQYNTDVEGLHINPSPINLIVGETAQVSAIIKYTDNTTQDVTDQASWSVNSGLATISNTGVVQAISAGECNLEAIYSHWNGTDLTVYSDTAQVLITAPVIPEPPITPPEEPVIPPVEPEIPPVIPSNPGSGGSYTEPETTVIVTPQAPEEPEIVEEEPEVEIEEEQEVIEEEPIEVTNPEPESNQTSLAVAKIPIAPVKYNTTQVAEEQPKGIIKGILKMKDGTPLSNARLELHSQPLTTYTDINGYFEFRDVELGSHILYLADANITDEKVTLKSVTVQDGNNSFQLNKIAEIIRGEAVEVTSVYLDKEELEKEIYIIAELSAAELSQPIEQNEVEEETQLKKVIMSILPLLIILLLLLIIILIRRRNRNEEY